MKEHKMTGRELMEKLSALSEEQLNLHVVCEGEDAWFYGAYDVRTIKEKNGRQRDDGEPVIALICDY